MVTTQTDLAVDQQNLFANSAFRAAAGIRHRGAPAHRTAPPARSPWPTGRLTRGSTDRAETTTLRKLRYSATRRGLDAVWGARRKSLCFSASCREITHRWTRCGRQPWRACRRVSPSMTFQTSCSWFVEETLLGQPDDRVADRVRRRNVNEFRRDAIDIERHAPGERLIRHDAFDLAPLHVRPQLFQQLALGAECRPRSVRVR